MSTILKATASHEYETGLAYADSNENPKKGLRLKNKVSFQKILSRHWTAEEFDLVGSCEFEPKNTIASTFAITMSSWAGSYANKLVVLLENSFVLRGEL